MEWLGECDLQEQQYQQHWRLGAAYLAVMWRNEQVVTLTLSTSKPSMALARVQAPHPSTQYFIYQLLLQQLAMDDALYSSAVDAQLQLLEQQLGKLMFYDERDYSIN